jgi:hypothetical protein
MTPHQFAEQLSATAQGRLRADALGMWLAW